MTQTQSAGAQALPRAATPEEVGVSSRAVWEFMEDCERNAVEVHSFMILRHGRVAAEVWRKPFRPDVPHTMFSHSKSFTSIAVGFAVEEGLLTLDTRVADVFPGQGRQSASAKSLTVRHLLTMTAGKLDNPFLFLKKHPDWTYDFLKRSFIKKPGKKFLYTSANTYLLCAVLHKITGQTVTQYLTPRLFAPLGIDVPYWETDPAGVETGGWGLQIKTEDQAKFIQCCLDGGVWQGKQVIPKAWLRQATAKQVENAPGVLDNCVGYGYQFWRCHVPDSYRADGLYSQFAIAFEAYDACIVINGGEPSEPKTLAAVWRHFPAGFLTEPAQQRPEDGLRLRQAIDCFSLDACCPASPRNPQMEAAVCNKHIHTNRKRFATVMGTPNFMLLANKPGRLDDIVFRFDETGLEFSWQEENSPRNVLRAAMDGTDATSQIQLGDMRLTTVSRARWREDGCLELYIRPLELVQARRMVFAFRGKRVRVHSKAEQGLPELVAFYLGFIGLKVTPTLRAAGRFLGRIATPIADPDFRGRLK